MLNTKEPLLTLSLIIIVYSLATNYLIADEVTNYQILHWGHRLKIPYLYLGKGRKSFIQNNCKYTNCYVSKSAKFYKTKFDAILFDLFEIFKSGGRAKFVPPRLPEQKYIFTSVETCAYYPICNFNFNNYFNWTWTYRLDSDFWRGYITVYNMAGEIVGPKINKTWPSKMNPITEDLKFKLQYKSELAAWFVSNCKSNSERRQFIDRVQEVLTELGGYSVDIFGRCGKFDCPRGSSKCGRMLQRDYFFYMAFENSFDTDYITEKVMTALDNYNVPVVYGGADYSRLLPPGSYLNARELGPEKLARTMVGIKGNISAYHDFFRWRNHFRYKETTYTDNVCSLCAMMNDDKKRVTRSTLANFSGWWKMGMNCTTSKHSKPNMRKSYFH